MPIPAGGIVTAGQLARMQPTPYKAVASVAVTGPATNADVPGCSITLTTLAPNAIIVAETVFDFDPIGTVNGLSSGRLWIDGAGVGEFAVYQAGPGVVADRNSAPQNYREVIPSAGTHTLKLVTTLATGVNLNIYTTLIVTVYEVV
ncbi:hypothetical protein ACFW0I_37665 [[Kitasatospora] papulosa]|uniref:hypothetical protein n=1 Tax=[Kitasatospora] papulosa TaxID=1464011 RepID=UPI0036AE2043